MRTFFRNPQAIFLLSMIFIAAILFLVPLNVFDGEITFNGSTQWVPWKLSLSNFIGIGTEDAQREGVADFRLTGMGYFLAFLLIVCLPALIGYRVKIANENESRKRRDGSQK